MSLKFAGVPLPLATPQLEGWFDSIAPLDLYKFWDAWSFEGTELTLLPTPPLPLPPKFRLGVLSWPTGAVRPAWFHFVVNTDKLNEIRAAVGDPMTPHYLYMNDGRAGKEIAASMYMLPPVPQNALGIDSSDGWVVTLTDQRFYWPWRRGSFPEIPESWAELYGTVSGSMGISIDIETVPSAYLKPTQKWRSIYQPPATILDAIATSVGQRVVVDLDGNISTVGWANAKIASDLYVDASGVVVSGGFISDSDIGLYVPASVDCVFSNLLPSFVPLATFNSTEPQSPLVIGYSLAGLAIPEYGSAIGIAGASGIIFPDAYLDIVVSEASLNTLALQAATDWYGWRLPDLDISYPGIEPWEPTGWEDMIEWTYQKRADKPFASTRIIRGVWSDFASGGVIPPIYRQVCSTLPGHENTFCTEFSSDGGQTWQFLQFLGMLCVQPGGGGSGSGGSGSGSPCSLCFQDSTSPTPPPPPPNTSERTIVSSACVNGITYNEYAYSRIVYNSLTGTIESQYYDYQVYTSGCCSCPGGSVSTPQSGELCPGNPMSASLTAEPNTGSAPIAILFTVVGLTGGIAPYSYAFNFGDGVESFNDTGVTTHTYTEDGTYIVSVTITDFCHNTYTALTTVTLGSASCPDCDPSGYTPLAAAASVPPAVCPSGIPTLVPEVDYQFTTNDGFQYWFVANLNPGQFLNLITSAGCSTSWTYDVRTFDDSNPGDGTCAGCTLNSSSSSTGCISITSGGNVNPVKFWFGIKIVGIAGAPACFRVKATASGCP